MTKPWEKYQTAAQKKPGPWAKYGTGQTHAPSPEMQSALSDLSAMSQKPEVQHDDPGALRSAFVGGAQGATFGFADEIAARLLSMHPQIDYDKALPYLRGEIEDARATHPVVTTGAEIAGAIASPVSKIGSGWAAGANTVGQAATRLGIVGAGQGAAYNFGSGEGGFIERGKDAALGALIGGGVGAAIPYVARGVQKLASGVSDRAAVNSAIKSAPRPDDLRASANQLYAQADQVDNLPRGDFSTAMGGVLQKAERAGLDADLTPGASKVADRITDAATTADPNIGFRELDILRRKAAVPAGNVSNRTEQSLASQMIDGIDEFIDNADPNLSGVVKDAREMWGRLRRVETVEKAIDRAKNAASGFENGLRVEFRKILNNPKLARGFNGRELAAIKTVVSGTKMGNVMRQIGRMGLGISGQSNGLGATVSGLGASALGGPIAGVAAVGAGTVAKKAAEMSATSAANRALGIIAARPNIPAQVVPQLPSEMINRLAPTMPAAIPSYNALRGR